MATVYDILLSAEARNAQVKYQRTKELMEAELGADIVALDTERGRCFGFNEVAAWVWRRLEAPATFEQLHHGLLEAFEVGEDECRLELRALLEDLVAKDLVSISQAPA